MTDRKLRLEERIEAGLRAGNIAWWEMELPSGKVSFDDRKAEMLGYPPELFKTFEDFTRLVHPDDHEKAMQAMRDHLSGAVDRYEVEYRIQTKDGSYQWFRDIGAITERDEATGFIRVIGIVENITARKVAEESLRTAVAQKERLMRELNHRVKNNLHMISSLVQLKNEAAGGAVDLSDVTDQIEAIALIHDNLSLGDSVDSIDFGHYLETLLPKVFSFYSGGDVAIRVSVDNTLLPTDTAVTLGLIVNELATNAIKHGFVPGEEPRFSVHLKRQGRSGEYVLLISNSGNPFPDEVDLEKPDSLGLQLIAALVGQLGGRLSVEKSPSPEFMVRFPAPDK